jgi:hypothetical protein
MKRQIKVTALPKIEGFFWVGISLKERKFAKVCSLTVRQTNTTTWLQGPGTSPESRGMIWSRELGDLLDLQASIFVGNNVYDQDRFANHVYSDHGFGRGGNLWQLDSALIRTVFDLNVRDPYVKDDLSWSINDGMDHRLQEGFQRWRATN